MSDRYTKIVLTVIAVCLSVLAADVVLRRAIPEAHAQNTVYVAGGSMDVRVRGGRLDYETDTTSGPTLKVCTNC